MAGDIHQPLHVPFGDDCYGAGNQRIDQGEPETYTPTVGDRLVKAGIRLGGLLNEALRD